MFESVGDALALTFAIKVPMARRNPRAYMRPREYDPFREPRFEEVS